MHAQPPQLPPLKQQRRPRATAAVILNYGDTVSIGGMLFVISPGLAPVSAGPVPAPPPPPPPNARIGGYKHGNRDWTTIAVRGENFWILGSGFGTPTSAAFGRVQIGGMEAVIKNWSDIEINLQIPDLAPGIVTAAVTLFWLDSPSAAPKLLANGPPLALEATPAPPIPLPTAIGLYAAAVVDATGGRLSTVHPGQVVTIEGHGFGLAPGRVEVCHQPTSVQAWTDTAIVIVVPSLTAGPCALLIRRPDGAYYESFAFQVAP